MIVFILKKIGNQELPYDIQRNIAYQNCVRKRCQRSRSDALRIELKHLNGEIRKTKRFSGVGNFKKKILHRNTLLTEWKKVSTEYI